MNVSKSTPIGAPVLLVLPNLDVVKTRTTSAPFNELHGELVVFVNSSSEPQKASNLTVDEDPIGIGYLSELTDLERSDYMNAILLFKFCGHCWGITNGGSCSCWNDE